MAASQETVARFRAALTRAFTLKTEKIDDQLDFDHKYAHLFKREYDTAIGLIVSVKAIDTLVALMVAYLDLYGRYSANANNVHYYRSDQTFSELIQRSVKVPSDKRDLFQEWARTLDGSVQSADFPTLRKRFDELSTTYRAQIASFIAGERERRRKAGSILDVLRAEYLRRYGFTPSDDANLDDFDPYPDPAFGRELSEQYQQVAEAWKVAASGEDPDAHKAFITAFEGFVGNPDPTKASYLTKVSASGVLPVFQVVKFMRDLMARKVEHAKGRTLVSGGTSPPFVPELYAAACMRLLIVANRKLALTKNRLGFTDEELAYFVRPVAGAAGGFEADVARRIAAKPDQWQSVIALSKAFLSLVLLTRFRSTIQLVPIEQALDFQARWLRIKQAADRLAQSASGGNVDRGSAAALASLLEGTRASVEITGGEVLGQGEVGLGSSLGARPGFGESKIIHIDPRSFDFYIEFDQLKPFLFRISYQTAHDWLFDKRKLEIARSAAFAAYVGPGVFLVAGFLPVLVEAGFAGLLYEVGVYVASVGAEEVVSKINPTAGKVVGFLAQLVTPRPRFGPKMVAPLPERAVKVMSVEAPETARSLEELFASQQEAARLTSDFEKSTAKGALTHSVNAARDKAAELQLGLEELFGDVKFAPEPAALTDTGITYRVADAPTTAGTAGRGSRRGAAAGGSSPAVARLEKSKEWARLEEYLPMLEEGDKLTARRLRTDIASRLDRGLLPYGQARQQIVNLLNAAKETTGEYVADGLVWSTYKVRRVVDIPRRTEKVPILDRVYEVESHDAPGQVFYVFAEIKGGPRTRLGSVSDKAYEYSAATGLVEHTLAGRVPQADPKWYYQKIIEIFENGTTAAERQRNQALARELFESAKAGKVQSLVIKSGRDLDPFVRVDENFSAWFKNRVLPYDRPRR